MKFIGFFISTTEAIGILMGIALNLGLALDVIDILTILSCVYEREMLVYLFRFILTYFRMIM